MNSKRLFVFLMVCMLLIAIVTAASTGSKKKSSKNKERVNLGEVITLVNDVTQGFRAWLKLHAIIIKFLEPFILAATQGASVE